MAQRVRELVDAGDATPGEIVLLFAAGTDAEWFEEELRAVGLPTYRAAGRNYFGQQQVVDLLAYLRLLHNRYDDEALLTVLASPFVGVSNDALVLIRAEAQRQPIFRALERPLPATSPRTDQRLLLAFRQRYDRLLDVAAAAPLELLCERVVAEHDYDLAILTRRDGQRRYANLRKLARLARSYEELRGRRPRGLRPVRRRAGGARREGVGRGLGGGGRRRGAPAHDPRGEGPRVQGRRRRRRRPEPPSGLGHPRALRRALRLQGRPPGDGDAGRHRVVQGRQGAPRPRRAGRAAAPLLRRDDARDGAADRLRLDRRAGRRRATRRRSAGC